MQRQSVFEVPKFNATFTDSEARYNFPISDHDPVVLHTAAGIIISLNIWCPGSRIAPTIKNNGVLNLSSQQAQMELMADYLFEMARDGQAIAFMLQEIPNFNTASFNYLNIRLQKLCAQHNQKNPNQKIDLRFDHWSQTHSQQFGTCVLKNTAQVRTALKASPPYQGMDGRFALYEIQSVPNPAIKFDIYNIHGEFTQQAQTAKFIQEKVNQGAMVCGDTNISKDANLLQSYIQVSNPHYQTQSGRLNTLDVFYDPFTLRYQTQFKAVQQAPQPVSYAPAQQGLFFSSQPTSQPFSAIYQFQTANEAFEYVRAFSVAADTDYPRDKRNYLLNLKLVGNTVTITDPKLNDFLKEMFALSSSEKPASYTPAQQTLFSSSRPNQAFSAIYQFQTAQEALECVWAFSVAADKDYPRDNRGYLVDLKLAGNIVTITDQRLNDFLKEMFALSSSDVHTSTPPSKPNSSSPY